MATDTGPTEREVLLADVEAHLKTYRSKLENFADWKPERSHYKIIYRLLERCAEELAK